ncbi:MAG: hypothetical protein ACE5I7_09190 [Candidatus Binatia bacterium]
MLPFDVTRTQTEHPPPLAALNTGQPGPQGLTQRQLSPPALSRARLPHLGIGLVYLALCLVVTYPLVRHFSTHLAGNRRDLWIYAWDIWWVAKSLTEGHLPFFTRYLYFPHGASLAFHSLWLPATVWSPLVLPHLGLIAWYNTLLLFSLFTSAAGAYALAFYLTRSVPASFLGGLIYAFNANLLDQALGHPATVMGIWLPLFLLAVLVLVHTSSWRRRLAACAAGGGFAVLGVLTRPALSIAGFYVAAFLLARSIGKQLTWKAAIGWFAGICVVTLVLGGPYFAMWYRAGPIPAPPHPKRNRIETAVSVESFLIPPPRSVLWEWWSHQHRRRNTRLGRIAFLGYSLIALLGGGVVATRRDPQWRGWALCGLFFILLSLGRRLLVWEHVTKLPLPYGLLPGVALVRASNRFVPAAMLCFALAAALVWERFRQRVGSRAASIGGTSVVAAIFMLEHVSIPFPSVQPAVSPFYQQLTAQRELFGLVEIPNKETGADKMYMYYQTLHEKPLHAGHLSRLPKGTFRYLRSVPLLNYLAREGRAPGPGPERIDVTESLHVLRASNFRYMIFHRYFPGGMFRGLDHREQQVLFALSQAIGPPAYQDNLLVAFDLRRTPHQQVVLRRVRR